MIRRLLTKKFQNQKILPSFKLKTTLKRHSSRKPDLIRGEQLYKQIYEDEYKGDRVDKIFDEVGLSELKDLENIESSQFESIMQNFQKQVEEDPNFLLKLQTVISHNVEMMPTTKMHTEIVQKQFSGEELTKEEREFMQDLAAYKEKVYSEHYEPSEVEEEPQYLADEGSGSKDW